MTKRRHLPINRRIALSFLNIGSAANLLGCLDPMRLLVAPVALLFVACVGEAVLPGRIAEGVTAPGGTLPNPPGTTVHPSGSADASTPLVARIVIEPPTAVVAPNGQQGFQATALDAEGKPVIPTPVFRWAVEGGGTLSAAGLFQAGAASGGPFTVTATVGSVVGRASVTIRAPLGPVPTPTTYQATCDGSGGVALDDQHFLNLNDEDQVARVYRRGTGAPVGSIDLSSRIGLSGGGEADFEDAARIGNRVYVVSSHGRNASGNYQASRYRFVAMDVVGAAPSVNLQVVGYSASLLVDLLDAANWATPEASVISLLESTSRLGTSSVPSLAPEIGGTSIEGLASFPSAATPNRLVIGFRNPQTSTGAILVTLLNPDAVAMGQKAKFGQAYQLDLGGLGVRSLAWSPGHQAVLVLAGPKAGGGEFRIYAWNGAAPTPLGMPLHRLTPPMNQNPEALIVYPGSPDVQLLFDLGDNLISGTVCKDVSSSERFYVDQFVRLN